jgi:Zn-dependent protease with chaperone function
MGSLGHVVLALAALAAAEAGLEHELLPPWTLLVLLPLPFVLARFSERFFLIGHFRLGEALHRVLTVSPPLLFLAALAVFGWRATVERWAGGPVTLLAWPDLRVLLVLAPWVAFELCALLARARTFVAAPERDAWLGFQTRMLVAGLTPVLVYVAAASLVGTSEELRVSVEEVGLVHAAFATLLLAALALGLPFLLEHVWDTAPLPPGPQRQALLALASQAGFGAPRLRVWRTGNQLANAAVVGLTRRSRTVLFSDLMLSQLPPRELAAVFAHEMGHAVRSHVPVFVAWILAAFLLGDLAAHAFFADDPLLSGAVMLAALLLWFALFSWLSRRCELEADLHALALLGETHTLTSALERVGGRIRDVAGWRHFSVADRVSFLERAQADPSVAERLRRTLRIAGALGIALFMLSLLLQAGRLVSDLPQDRVRAELRLGDYATAAERARDRAHLDPLLARLAARAGTLGSDGVGAERVQRELAAAVARGDSSAAADWRALLALRAGQ